jgi:hypothetical protein
VQGAAPPPAPPHTAQRGARSAEGISCGVEIG